MKLAFCFNLNLQIESVCKHDASVASRVVSDNNRKWLKEHFRPIYWWSI